MIGRLVRVTDRFEIGDEDGVAVWNDPPGMDLSDDLVGYMGLDQVALVLRVLPTSLGGSQWVSWVSYEVCTSRGITGWVDDQFLMEVL